MANKYLNILSDKVLINKNKLKIDTSDLVLKSNTKYEVNAPLQYLDTNIDLPVQPYIFTTTKEIKFEIYGNMTKSDISKKVLSFPNGIFNENCIENHNSTGVSLKYGDEPKYTRYVTFDPIFSFSCNAPKRIKFKCYWTDNSDGTSRLLSQLSFKDNLNDYIALVFFESRSNEVFNLGVSANVMDNFISSSFERYGTSLYDAPSNQKYMDVELVWENNNFIPENQYTFEFRNASRQQNGSGGWQICNPLYFDYLIVEF